ncbi:putative amino acid/polyamine transporter I [Dioscorea sansibarensis]
MDREIQLDVVPNETAPSADQAPPSSMGSSSQLLHQPILPVSSTPSNKLSLLPLIFLIYFEVSGGPFGAEPAVRAAGPLLALLGFLIFPFIWSVPEALITAELATAIPGNGGYVLWADRAFGPFAGSVMGSWKFLSGVINNAAYPVLCVDYLSRVIHPLSTGTPRVLAVVLFSVVLSFLNYTGLTIVGYTAVVLGFVSLTPFYVMAGFAIPRVHPHRWLKMGKDIDWRLYFNTLFWNLNFWDNASTLAGEVENPQRTFPKALLASGLMTCFGYLVPLLAGTGALDVPQEDWSDGYFADIAGMIAGRWLKFWIGTGAVLSAIGLYEAQLSSSSFQLLGMADLCILPQIFASRAKWFHTPWFASFLWLRRKHPTLKRPYRVPVGLPALVCMCLIPSAFLIFVMSIATWTVYVISLGLTLLGIGVYYLMQHCRSKGYLEFKRGEDKSVEVEEASGTQI